MTASLLDALRAELAEVGAERFTARDYRPGTFTHIVLFRYGHEVPAAARDEVKRRFLALGDTERDGEKYITSIVGGSPSGGESADRGFEHGFVLTFSSAGDRNYYVGTPVVGGADPLDPAHDAFKQFAGPFIAPDGVLVFDISS